jgi:hypothetical protein
MKTAKLRLRKGFSVVLENKRSQAATVIIPVGGKEGALNTFNRGVEMLAVT